MSNRRFLGLLAIIGSLACCSIANAQRYSPFVGLDYFDQDFKVFSPVDMSDYDGGPPPNTGFFFKYDRVTINISRPESFLGTELSAPYEGDWTWGNRYDMGYMTKDNHGWSFSIWDVRGPRFVDNIQPIVDPVFGDALGENNYSGFPFSRIVQGVRDDGIFGFTTDANGNQTPITRAEAYPNDPDDLLFQVRDRRTHSRFSSLELNKTYRVECGKGCYFEPFWGARYMNITDGQTEAAAEFDINDAQIASVGFTQHVENQILGAQIGGRYFYRKGRWTISSELRFTAAANWQLTHYQLVRNNGAVDANGDFITAGNPDTAQWNNAYDEFVPMGELRGEAQYNLTRDLAVQAGFAVLHFGNGVGRVETAPYDRLGDLNAGDPFAAGNNIPLFNTNQDLTAAAFTFGVSYRH
jgi:hypothetical protein